jgi:hypothetical protein
VRPSRLDIQSRWNINHDITPASSPYNSFTNILYSPGPSPTLSMAPVSSESSHFVEEIQKTHPARLRSNQNVGTLFRIPHRNVQSVCFGPGFRSRAIAGHATSHAPILTGPILRVGKKDTLMSRHYIKIKREKDHTCRGS